MFVLSECYIQENSTSQKWWISVCVWRWWSIIGSNLWAYVCWTTTSIEMRARVIVHMRCYAVILSIESGQCEVDWTLAWAVRKYPPSNSTSQLRPQVKKKLLKTYSSCRGSRLGGYFLYCWCGTPKCYVLTAWLEWWL